MCNRFKTKNTGFLNDSDCKRASLGNLYILKPFSSHGIDFHGFKTEDLDLKEAFTNTVNFGENLRGFALFLSILGKIMWKNSQSKA